MYRQYEDPRKLEAQLAEAIARTEQPGYETDDWITIAELRDRINYALQDEEYECAG